MEDGALVIQLWHLAVAGAAGVSAIIWVYRHIKTLRDESANAIKSAEQERMSILFKIDTLEKVVAGLGEKDKSICSRLDTLTAAIGESREESSKQHSQLKEELVERIHKLERSIIGCVKGKEDV